MARPGEIKVAITADDSQIQKTFDNVGSGAKDMARDIEKSSGDTSDAFSKLDDAAGGSERSLRGLRDGFTGTGDVMQGFKDGNIVQVIGGFTDLAGFVGDFAGPMLSKLVTSLGVSTAATGAASTANVTFGASLTAALGPIALVVAGIAAIIAIGVLVVKNWDTIKGAMGTLWDAFKGVYNWFRDVFGNVFGLIVNPFRLAFNAVAKAWNATVGKLSFKVPDWVPVIGGNGWDVPDLPTFHTGGVAGRDTLAVLQQGEQVVPRGQDATGGITINVMGSVITERDLGRIVADALRQNKLIGVT